MEETNGGYVCMIKKPNVCILRTDGTNCDQELFYAFEKAGGVCQMIHINELRTKKQSLNKFHILALPGGFTYGDDVASGKILALELISFFEEELMKFIAKGGYVFGVCNGFQTLVRTGLLPFMTPGSMNVTLTHNDSGHFECRWIRIKPEGIFSDLPILEVPVNHGEGKFYTDEKTLQKIENQGLTIFRYVDRQDRPTMNYPENPNGALHSIAGVTDKTGRILGLMPHPEKFVDITQHPNWRRNSFKKPHGLLFYEKIIQFVRRS